MGAVATVVTTDGVRLLFLGPLVLYGSLREVRDVEGLVA
jgi:hypothetical protein